MTSSKVLMPSQYMLINLPFWHAAAIEPKLAESDTRFQGIIEIFLARGFRSENGFISFSPSDRGPA